VVVLTIPYGDQHGHLGHRSAIGALSAQNLYVPGCWVVTFTPQDLSYPADFEVYHIAVRGPGGAFLVYIDDSFYSATDRGDLNEYDPKHPMYVRRGQSITFHWNVSVGDAPTVWVYAREPGLNI
jgi:hypothetical protein